MTASTFALAAASSWWAGTPPWQDGGGPWLFGPLFLALWIALLAVVGWLVIRTVRPRERSGLDRARDVLAERFARGELSAEEYQERFDQLRRLR